MVSYNQIGGLGFYFLFFKVYGEEQGIKFMPTK